MDSKRLHVRFIRCLLNNEINDYYEKIGDAKKQRDKVNLIRNLLDILEDEKLLKENKHVLTKDFEIIIKKLGMFYCYLPLIFDYNKSKVEYECKKIFESAKICYSWYKNERRYTYDQFRKAKENLLDILYELKNKYQEEQAKYISIRPNHPEVVINEYKEISSNLVNRKLINASQYLVLKKLFIEKQFTKKDIVILLERIKQHNIICHKKEKNEYFDFGKSYEIIDMISTGYEYIKIPDINSSRKSEINSNCQILYDQKLKLTIESMINYLPKYEGDLLFSNNYSKEEFDYYIFTLLKILQDNLYFCVNEIIDQESYNEKEYRNIIRDEYYKVLNIYNAVRNYYDEQINLYNQKEIDETLPDVNNISFTVRGTENEKTYFESDLKDVPKDLYGLIHKYLLYFKKGQLPSTYLKALKELGNGIWEIKSDQIRIVYKHMEENNFAILGIFIKKDNNDRSTYVKMASRNTQILLSGNEIEERIFDMLESKKHNGGRTNS